MAKSSKMNTTQERLNEKNEIVGTTKTRQMKHFTYNRLKELAIYLEGIKAGKGDLHPLGNAHIDALWETLRKEKCNLEQQ